MIEAKLASKQNAQHKSTIKIGSADCGGVDLMIIGGPCTVENEEQMEQVALRLKTAPVQALRGGVYKPRTSPYAFQGMGIEGLKILTDVRQRHQLPIVTEVMSIEQIDAVAAGADMLQVGSRNMQNFELLKALGKVQTPILLKRGLSATIEEFLMAG